MKEFYMTIGISGSGKSSFLKNFNYNCIICPDNIRKELTGSISDQTQNSQVWFLTKKRIIENINNLGIAILDATNTVSKNRKSFLKSLPDDVTTIAVVFPLPDIDLAFERIQKDVKNGVDRCKVPIEVIQRQAEQMKNGLSNIKDQFDKTIFIDENQERKSIT